jgi:hypothetical protein
VRRIIEERRSFSMAILFTIEKQMFAERIEQVPSSEFDLIVTLLLIEPSKACGNVGGE